MIALPTPLPAALLAIGASVWVLVLGWLIGIDAVAAATPAGIVLQTGVLAGGAVIALTGDRVWPKVLAILLVVGWIAGQQLPDTGALLLVAAMVQVAWSSRRGCI